MIDLTKNNEKGHKGKENQMSVYNENKIK